MGGKAQETLGKLTYGEPASDSDERLRQLVLYISDRCYEDPGFGATKLAKILYFSDFKAFARYGESITRAEYMSLPRGPVPKRLVHVKQRMEDNREIAIHAMPFKGKDQHRVYPLRETDLSLFTAEDIALVDAVISEHWGKTATEVSNLAHDRIWEIAGTQGRPVPKEAVFISSEPLTPYDIQRTKELAAEHGWEGF